MYSSWMKKYDEIVNKTEDKVMDLTEEELKATREIKAINKIVAGEEKTANEMFEELGYKKCDYGYKITYYKNVDEEDFVIEIMTESKLIFAEINDGSDVLERRSFRYTNARTTSNK